MLVTPIMNGCTYNHQQSYNMWLMGPYRLGNYRLRSFSENRVRKNLFAPCWSFCLTKLGFFIRHFGFSSVILHWKLPTNMITLLDILTDNPGSPRQTFSKLIRHVWRDWRISRSLIRSLAYVHLSIYPSADNLRHTYSGDIWPTRTCVPYVLLAMVWRNYCVCVVCQCDPHGHFPDRHILCMFSVNHQNKKSSGSPGFFKKYGLPCAPWCILRLGGAYCALMVHKYPIYHCSGA